MKQNDWLKSLSGIILGVFGIAICVGFLFVSHFEEKRRSLIHPISLCPVESSVKVWGFYEILPPTISRKIAVVIDATDKIPAAQRNEIIDWFKKDKFIDSLNKFAKVSIYQLSESIGDEGPEFEKCAPPSEANPWIESSRIVRKKFEGDFHNKLLKKIEMLSSKEEKNFSPILEMIEKVFDTHDEMILVSDLMQNTLGYSLYKNSGNHDYTNFLSNPYTADIMKNQQDKKLTAIYITRKKLGQWQNKELREFWRKHMESNGGEFELARTLSVIPY